MKRTYDSRRDDSESRSGYYVNEYITDDAGHVSRSTLYDGLTEERANRIIDLLEALEQHADWRA